MKQLRLRGTLDALKEIAGYVKAAAESAGLDSKKSYRLRLAVDEVAANIVIHGYQEAGLYGDLTVIALVTGNSVTITLEDSGLAFDPGTIPMPDEESLCLPVEERAIGGLGIFLVLKGVDSFSYQRDEEHKLNRNTFKMFRGEPV